VYKHSHVPVFARDHLVIPFPKTAIMSVQGAADAVKDSVQAVAEKVQEATISDNTNQDAAPAQASADGTTPNLLLDEVTGEKVSKSELKKRQKQREREAKKAEAAATKQAPPPPKKKAGSAEEEEAKLNPNVSCFVVGEWKVVRDWSS